MPHVETAIVVAKTITLVLGGLVTYLAFKAYRRTRAAALRALALGFGIITLGAIVAGIVDLLTGLGLLYGVLVQSTLTMVGFAVITYSLYAD
jgi:hypothetical protein